MFPLGKWAEYIKADGPYEEGIFVDTAKTRHAWNVFVLRQHRDADAFLSRYSMQ